MTIKEKNQEVYRKACQFLYEIKPDDISDEVIKKYFVGDRKDFASLEDVYEQLIHSAQNYQRMPNVIKYKERRNEIKCILSEFDVNVIKDYDVEELYQTFRQEFNVVRADNKFNSWHKWSKSIVDAAVFISNFKDVEDFKNFVNQFS